MSAPPDRGNREKAACTSLSPLVSAPAGSGKTSLLVLRFLRLLAKTEHPESVLAITFTRKAAAEMRHRVTQALRDTSVPASGEEHAKARADAASEARARHPELEGQPARLSIFTFDAFAGLIARRYPLAAGVGALPPAAQGRALYRDAALAAVEAADDATLDAALAVADGDLDWLVTQLGSWLMARDTLMIGPGDDGTDARVEAEALLIFSTQTLESLVKEQLEYIDAKRETLNRTLAVLARGRLAFLDERGSAAGEREELRALQDEGMPRDLDAWPRIRLALSLLLTKEGALRKARGVTKNAGFVLEKEDREELKALLDKGIAADERAVQALALLFSAPPELGYDEETRTRFAALYALYDKALRRLEEAMRARGNADFTAVMQGALRALPTPEEGGDPYRLERLDARLAHVLVDEFQDVSPAQREFLARICYGFDGKRKTLFCVGDPMQSIYRFRKAEPEIFLRLRRQIGRPGAREEGGPPLPLYEPLELKANFRSARGIVEWVNATFEAIAPHEDIPEVSAARFTKAEPTNDEKGEVVLHLGVGTTADDEAEHALRLLRAWLNDHPGERIAVLGRNRTTLEPLVRRLRAAGVPFRAVNIFRLADEPAARWVRALAAFAATGFKDSAAFASLLRSPLVGLDTAALARLLDAVRQASGGKAWTLDAVRKAIQVLPRQEDRRRAEHLLEALARMVEEMRVLPVALAVERALVRLGAFAWLDGRGRRDLAAALDALAGASEGGVVRLREFEEALDNLYAAPDASEDAARLEVLTMHGAKGLEWDAVLLFGLGRAPRKGQRDGQPRLRMARVGGGVLIAPPRFRRSEEGAPGSWDALVKAIENERERQEELRLLYVACTRAKKRLHLVGSVSEKEKPAGGSLLAFLGRDAAEIRDRFERTKDISPADEGEREGAQHARSPERVIAPQGEAPPEMEPAGAPPVFGWAGVEAHALGEALHRLLEEVARIGLECWEEEGRRPEPILRRALAQAGVAEEALEGIVEKALAGWEKVKGSERGRWLLSGRHEDAHAEWELVVRGEGGMPAVIRIDRSFVDEEGTRWVVDYKASFHEGGDLERFLEEELERYRPQLERYVQAVKALEPSRKVRAALYFPLMDAWRELE